MRADARRNRDRIVVAAHELFAEVGFGAPMEEIARRAGVGVGTLYRRFPDRDALIRAVSLHGLRQLADTATASLADEPDAWSALSRFVRYSAELRLGVLRSAMDPRMRDEIRSDPEVSSARHALVDAVRQIVDGAQAEGMMRPDVGPGDILLLISLLTRRHQELPADVAEALPARYLQLVLDGLRTRPPSPLPGHPLTSA